MELIKKYWIIFSIGLILRLVIAGITFHPDVRTLSLSSSTIFQIGSLNFYADSIQLPSRDILDDLPLSYLISLPVHSIFRLLVNINIENIFLSNTDKLFGSSSIIFYLLYTKAPLIFADLSLAFLLSLSVSNLLQKKVLFLWMFNPVTLWATSAIGQMDIYPTFFIFLSWLLIRKGKLSWAAFALGLGGAIKSGPFLLFPLLLGLGKNWLEKIKIIILVFLPYLITVMPYLQFQEFRQNALLAPQLAKSFFARISLSGGESIFITAAAILFIYFLYFAQKRSAEDFLKYGLVILLLILSFTHFHLQWFLWLIPFLIIWLINNWTSDTKMATAGIFTGFLMMLFLFDASLQIKLLAPVFPILDKAVGLSEILSSDQTFFLRSLAASIFGASSLFLVFKILRKN